MPLLAAASADASWLFVELGLVIVGLAILARLATRFGFSSIPLYLLAGLAFGNGGVAPLRFGEEFVGVGAEVGVVLLLFMLGLEYTGSQLRESLRTGLRAGLVDFVLNFLPGVGFGLILGLGVQGSILLGGVTYVSSSGVIAKVLGDLGRMESPEASPVITILVLEDLAMAVYLPIVAVLLAGQKLSAGLPTILGALLTVVVVLVVATRFGKQVSKLVTHRSDEVVLLTVLGLVLLVAGLAQRLHVSSAVGAFLVGVTVSGSLVDRTHRLFTPLRDLFAATFFFFFGLQINPAQLLPSLPIAIALGVLTAATKALTGWWAAGQANVDRPGKWRAAATLIARGEFSIVIAGLGAGVATVDKRLQPIAAAYVLLMAIVGPVLARVASSMTARAEQGNPSTL